MRIAMLGWEFPPFISGGLGVHCFELTQRLANMGHKIDFYLPSSGKTLSSPHASIRLIETSPSVLQPYFSFNKKGKLATYGEGLLKAVEVYNTLAAKMVAEEHAKNPYALVHAHDWLTAPGVRFWYAHPSRAEFPGRAHMLVAPTPSKNGSSPPTTP